jgi:GT2 family glycosyltransferase
MTPDVPSSETERVRQAQAAIARAETALSDREAQLSARAEKAEALAEQVRQREAVLDDLRRRLQEQSTQAQLAAEALRGQEAEAQSSQACIEEWRLRVRVLAERAAAESALVHRLRAVLSEKQRAQQAVAGLRREAAQRREEFQAQISRLQARSQALAARGGRGYRAIRKRLLHLQEILCQEEALRADLEKTPALLGDRDRDMQVVLAEIRAVLAALQPAVPSIGGVPPGLLRQLRHVVRAVVPADATLLVVSRGEEPLLQFFPRRCLPFPQTDSGARAAEDPLGSTAAIACLEVLRAKGAAFLLLPAHHLSWLKRYPAFHQHLERCYRFVHRSENCIVVALRPAPDTGPRGWRTEVEKVVSDLQEKFERAPVILDWHTGLNLAACFPQLSVFSPPSAEATLPYIDETVDLVAVSSPTTETAAEAERVTRAAVVAFSSDPRSEGSAPTVTVTWKDEPAGTCLPSASIIIVCRSSVEQVAACLSAVALSLPGHFRGEVLLVDDASTDGTARLLAGWSAGRARVRVLRNRRSLGRLRSCNRAARVARGDVLVFLGDQTLPQRGWYLSLLRLLRQHPDAGAVSGKVVRCDGRLESAGGIVFADGSITNFGEGDWNPDAAVFGHVREVDFSATELLATRRDLFLDVGGFDTAYHLPLHADADYGLRLRARGQRILYQPDCLAVLQCSRSTPEAGRERALDRVRLFENWQATLGGQPARPTWQPASAWLDLALGPLPSGGEAS